MTLITLFMYQNTIFKLDIYVDRIKCCVHLSAY